MRKRELFDSGDIAMPIWTNKIVPIRVQDVPKKALFEFSFSSGDTLYLNMIVSYRDIAISFKTSVNS